MEMVLYNTIVTTIRNHKELTKDCFVILKENFPDVNSDTLYSILSLEYQKRMRTNHVKTPARIEKYWTQYNKAKDSHESPGIIIRMSKEFDVAPCLIAKQILQKFIHQKGLNEQPNTFLRDTASIPDMDLAYEVFLCTNYDNIYSPITDVIRHSLGQEYEIKLYHQVKDLGLAFRDEEYLRRYGYDKTPDIKLDVPVAVSGFIINWIESKALFGTAEAHEEYIKNQYHSYWNRFGPGLVIYWFGYAKCILDPNEKRFIINSCLPTDEIVQLLQNCS